MHCENITDACRQPPRVASRGMEPRGTTAGSLLLNHEIVHGNSSDGSYTFGSNVALSSKSFAKNVKNVEHAFSHASCVMGFAKDLEDERGGNIRK